MLLKTLIIIFIIVLLIIFIGLFTIFQKKIGESKKITGKKVILLGLVIVVLLLLNSSLLPIFSPFIEGWYKDNVSSKPAIEIYVNSFKRVDNLNIFGKGNLFYLAQCEKSDVGAIMYSKIINRGNEKITEVLPSFISTDRGCVECGYYNIGFMNFGDVRADEIIIKGNLESNKKILTDVISEDGAKKLGTEKFGNSFAFSTLNFYLNKPESIGKIFSEERAPINIDTCLVDGLNSLCNMIYIDSEILVFNRTQDNTFVFPNGLQVSLPPLSKGSSDIYVFDTSSEKFVLLKNESLLYEGGICV